MNSKEVAFCLGFGSGLQLKKTGGTAWSPRDVLKHFRQFSHSEVDTFLSGQWDALQRDSSRYDGICQKYILPNINKDSAGGK